MHFAPSSGGGDAGLESGGEAVRVTRGEAVADGARVPAVPAEMLGDAIEQLFEMQAGQAAAGAAPRAVRIQARQERRQPEGIDEAGGGDPQDSGVPALACEGEDAQAHKKYQAPDRGLPATHGRA